MKASVVVAANCVTDGFRAVFRNSLYALDVLVWGRTLSKHDDEVAHSVIRAISSSLEWDQRSTVDWYAFQANTSTVQSGNKLRIQVIGLKSSTCLSVCHFIPVQAGLELRKL